ncbi:MAG: hypothetical protein ACTSUE_27230 [Promethearchaeota archaeon]
MFLQVDLNSEAFYQLIELMLMGMCVGFFFFYSGQFFKRNRNKDAFEIERKLNVGYFLFFLALGLGYGSYVMDRVWRYVFGVRFFQQPSYDSAFSSDYFIPIFTFLSVGFIVLSYVVEKYILSRKRPIIFIICIIGLVLTLSIRFIEGALLPIIGEAVEYIGYVSYIIVLIVFIMLFTVYVKIAKAAPAKSDLWNRSVSFLVGITVMVIMLAGGNNQFSKEAAPGTGYIAWIGPFLTLTALFILQYGLSKKS